MLEWLHSLHSAEGIRSIMEQGGLIALIAIIFSETGLLVGFFLPGDSLLITAGIACNPNTDIHLPNFNILTINLLLVLAAVIGDQVGFVIGRKVGNKIWERPDGRFYKRKYMEEAHEFYMRHGGLAIFGARYIPILRTFVPFAAGVARMPYKNFVFWNIFGGVTWITTLLWAGYFLGNTPWAKRVDQVIVVVIFVSVLPLIFGTAKRLLKGRSAPATPAPAAKAADEGEA